MYEKESTRTGVLLTRAYNHEDPCDMAEKLILEGMTLLVIEGAAPIGGIVSPGKIVRNTD